MQLTLSQPNLYIVLRFDFSLATSILLPRLFFKPNKLINFKLLQIEYVLMVNLGIGIGWGCGRIVT